MKPKTAKLKALRYFEVECPECGDPMDNPVTGSQMFDPFDVEPGQVLHCTCGAEVRMPTRIPGR